MRSWFTWKLPDRVSDSGTVSRYHIKAATPERFPLHSSQVIKLIYLFFDVAVECAWGSPIMEFSSNKMGL